MPTLTYYTPSFFTLPFQKRILLLKIKRGSDVEARRQTLDVSSASSIIDTAEITRSDMTAGADIVDPSTRRKQPFSLLSGTLALNIVVILTALSMTLPSPS